jgi:hypothetical protein
MNGIVHKRSNPESKASISRPHNPAMTRVNQNTIRRAHLLQNSTYTQNVYKRVLYPPMTYVLQRSDKIAMICLH